MPSPEQSYVKALSNWGRWGDDDHLGTLNLVTEPKRASAAAVVRHGLVVSCALDLDATGDDAAQGQPRRRMLHTGGPDPRRAGTGDGFTSAAEAVEMTFHGRTITHLDGLGHGLWDGQLYNGVSGDTITEEDGSTVLSISDVARGVVTRGVLLDVAGTASTDGVLDTSAMGPEELEAAERRGGVQVGAGDAVLLRTGYAAGTRLESRPAGPANHPGWTAACLPWLYERDVALIGHDTPGDSRPSGIPDMRVPVHSVAIPAMGLWLVDNCNLDELRDTCERLNQWEFLFVVAPLRLVGGTGSPVNPLAIF